MNHIVKIDGKSLVFKLRSDAVSTAKRKIMLGVDNVTLSTGYPGVFDDANTIKTYADTHWFNRGHITDIADGSTSDHWCDKCGMSNHPEGQDQPTDIGHQIRQAPGW